MVKLPLPPPQPDGSYRLTADQLYDCYRVDKNGASRFLEGKTVVVDSTVFVERTRVEVDKKRTERGQPTHPELVLNVAHESNGFWTSPFAIVCRFTDADRPLLRLLLKHIKRRGAQIDNVTADDRAVVHGVIAEKFGDVNLDNCSLEGVITADGRPAPGAALLTSNKTNNSKTTAVKEKQIEK